MSMKQRGIIALDGMPAHKAFDLARNLSGKVWGFKANDLLDSTVSAERIISEFARSGRTFADLKLHDIPSTVANRVRRHATNGADLITVHASGGVKMLEAAVKAYREAREKDGLGILAVTVLTSIDLHACVDIYHDGPEKVVEGFAAYAAEAGCYGIVCSPAELPLLRGKFPGLKLVTPGVRSPDAATHDQARVDTPANAVHCGADFLVIGRQVTLAEDPIAAVDAIDAELKEMKSAQ